MRGSSADLAHKTCGDSQPEDGTPRKYCNDECRFPEKMWAAHDGPGCIEDLAARYPNGARGYCRTATTAHRYDFGADRSASGEGVTLCVKVRRDV